MSPGRLLTDMNSEEFSVAIFLQMQREMLIAIREVNTNLHEMQKGQADIATRLAKIEAKPIEDYIKELADLKASLRALQERHIREDGAKSLVAWLKDYTPWLFAIGAALFAYMTKGPGK